MMMTAPTKSSERSLLLDSIRGIALFGIFLNNVYGFSGYPFLPQESRKQFASYPFDKAVDIFQHLFIEGKFYSLFSLLFGIGFSIILLRNKEKGLNGLKIFYRRIFILAFIGFLHLRFLWQGDILLLYAMLGCLLPLFRNCTDRALLIWAATLILSPILIDTLKIILQASPGSFLENIAIKIDAAHGLDDNNWRTYLFKEGSGFREWFNWLPGGPYWRYEGLLNSNRLPKVLGMFLIGFYAGRKHIYSSPGQYKLLLKKIMIWGFAIGVPASIALVWFAEDEKFVFKSAWGLLDTFFYAISVVPLSLAYASSIAMLWIKTGGNTRIKVFAPAGRMALTNYLAQTIIGIIIFYGLGFGLGQKIGLAACFGIVIVVYALQVLYSRYWFKYFLYGPLEWIWRQLTYGKKLPLRKGPNENLK